MRQFEVYPNPSKASAAFAPYILVLQSHHLNVLDTIVVAPVVMDASKPIAPLDVPVQIGDQHLVVAIGELGVVSRSSVRRRITDLSAHEDAIRRALDRLFTGF